MNSKVSGELDPTCFLIAWCLNSFLVGLEYPEDYFFWFHSFETIF
jgi:hypothetical protein